ncbi:hypothetical protein JD292_07640 [Leucobacter sp. CSA2]|uniref:Uncharacterized protein n=1 Tax=Leucobacter edaphi TaxID=2796472 RepID=A0A934QC54_9MICO|nr:hypothetical protein [Leucobacter edaphi]MBK0421946.1 hypothetical protein [Leucobacter edaphi]
MTEPGADRADRGTELAADTAAVQAARPPQGVSGADEGPERVPARVWVTLVGFAAFVLAFGTCAANYLFN